MIAAKKIAVVINPHSAGGRALQVWPEFQQKLEADGYRIASHVSASEADFRTRIAAYARGFHKIAVCGGDSSLTIAAEELIKKKFRGDLVFLPAGSVNDIVLDIREQTAGSKKSAFLGSINTGADAKYFIGQANWGLGVVVNRWVGNVLRGLPFLRPLQNLIGTLSIIFAHLLRREIVKLSISADRYRLSGIYSLVLVSQIKYWASGLNFCPMASYLDPKFQVVAIRRCGLVRLIRIILASKTSGHLQYAEVETFQAKRVEIHSQCSLAVQIDGDILRKSGKEIHSEVFSLKKCKSAMRLTL